MSEVFTALCIQHMCYRVSEHEKVCECTVADLPSWAASRRAAADSCSTAPSGCTAALPPPRRRRNPAREDEDGDARDSEPPECSVLARCHHGNAGLSTSLHTRVHLRCCGPEVQTDNKPQRCKSKHLTITIKCTQWIHFTTKRS